MLGMLPPEGRQRLRTLWWSPPMRKYQVLVLGAVGLFVASNFACLLLISSATQPGITAPETALFVVMFVAMAILAVGILLRREALHRLAIHTCPNCDQPNLWTAGYCQKCGTQLPEREGPAVPAGPLPGPGTK